VQDEVPEQTDIVSAPAPNWRRTKPVMSGCFISSKAAKPPGTSSCVSVPAPAKSVSGSTRMPWAQVTGSRLRATSLGLGPWLYLCHMPTISHGPWKSSSSTPG
jgi:hypothetical protein